MKPKHLYYIYIFACIYYLLCAIFIVHVSYYKHIRLDEHCLQIARVTAPREFVCVVMTSMHKLGSEMVFHAIVLFIISLIIFILTYYSFKKSAVLFIALFILFTSLFALMCFDYFLAVIWVILDKGEWCQAFTCDSPEKPPVGLCQAFTIDSARPE